MQNKQSLACLVLCMLQNRRTGGELAIGASAYTIKSHGASLARNHMQDWVILILLAVIEIILYLIRPFHRFVGKDMMTDLKYPFKHDTVPAWSVPVSSLSFSSIFFF